MTRDAFLHALRRDLSGLPTQEIDDILADYAAHFAESEASGRSEIDVAAALGDPSRIARELRAEAGLQRFQANWSMSNLLAAVVALASLAVVDIVFLLPLLIAILFCALGLAIALLVMGAVGLKIILFALFFHTGAMLTETLARVFIGAGLVGCLVGGGALLLLGLGAGIRVLGHYARLHSRLAQPGQHTVSASLNRGVEPQRSMQMVPGKLACVAVTGLIGAVLLLVLGLARSGPDRANAGHWWRSALSSCGSAASNRQQVSLPFTASDNLTIDLPASVHYQPGDKAEAVVSGDPALLDHVRIEGSRLSLDCNPGWDGSRLTIRLLGPAITSWTVLGSGDLALTQINQPQLRLSIRGSGSVAAAGVVDTVGLEISGSGAARLKSLTARSVEVGIRGSGDAQMTAQADADVSISGSGNVELFGSPVLRRSQIRGSGRIVQVP